MIKEAKMEALFEELFREWELDLFPQEQEIWLWNSMVQMKKIKQKRDCLQEFVEHCQV